MEVIGKYLFWAVVTYIAFVIALYLSQRNFMYFPDRMKPDISESGVDGKRELSVQTEDQLTLTGWYHEPAEGKPVVIWFHGNGLHHAYRMPRVIPLIENGYGVLLASYRGYAGNPGKPTEQGLYKDARAFIKAIQDKGHSVVLYGESLGTGVAVQMAIENSEIPAVILEAPYTSTVDVGQERFPIAPVRWLMKDRFESIKKVPALNRPLLILHGQKDMIVPYKYGARLFEAASEPKMMQTYPKAGHLDLYEFGAASHVLTFLEASFSGMQ
ncbi:MAG: alpha/beta hydrolase [Pseudomonadota bacterium]